MKLTWVYKGRSGACFVVPMNITTSGVYIGTGSVHETTCDEPAELGRLLSRALDESGRVVPHPEPGSGITPPASPLYAMMKVSSTRSFFRQAVGVCVELDTDAGTACAVPTSNLGPKLGFATMRDERRCVVLDDELSLGQAVIDTFAIARPWVA